MSGSKLLRASYERDPRTKAMLLADGNAELDRKAMKSVQQHRGYMLLCIAEEEKQQRGKPR
jgi:hypothetical protein